LVTEESKMEGEGEEEEDGDASDLGIEAKFTRVDVSAGLVLSFDALMLSFRRFGRDTTRQSALMKTVERSRTRRN
jgi:hypothetical protein